MAQDALEEQGYSLEWETVDDGYRYALRDQEQEIVNVAWSACRGRFYGNS